MNDLSFFKKMLPHCIINIIQEDEEAHLKGKVEVNKYQIVAS